MEMLLAARAVLGEPGRLCGCTVSFD